MAFKRIAVVVGVLALAGVAAASGLYGAGMRNVKVVTDQNGWVV